MSTIRYATLYSAMGSLLQHQMNEQLKSIFSNNKNKSCLWRQVPMDLTAQETEAGRSPETRIQNEIWARNRGVSVQELFPVAPILRGWGRRTVKSLMPAWAIANPYIIIIVIVIVTVIIIVTYILNLLNLFTCACIHMSTYMFHGPRVKVLPPCGFPRDWSSSQVWQQVPFLALHSLYIQNA